jgi:hypothetical protein
MLWRISIFGYTLCRVRNYIRVNVEGKEVARLYAVTAMRAHESSAATRDATKLQQTGLEKYQSRVKESGVVRVWPWYFRRAKLQGTADCIFLGEATRGSR